MFFADLVGGDVGLAISSCITLTGMLQWGVRQSAEVENLMTSVERIMEYSRLEQETLSTDLFYSVTLPCIGPEKKQNAHTSKHFKFITPKIKPPTCQNT